MTNEEYLLRKLTNRLVRLGRLERLQAPMIIIDRERHLIDVALSEACQYLEIERFPDGDVNIALS